MKRRNVAMFLMSSYRLDKERINVMIYKILDEEKKNIKTKAKTREDMVRKIETIITSEARRLK